VCRVIADLRGRLLYVVGLYLVMLLTCYDLFCLLAEINILLLLLSHFYDDDSK